jgi:hypothetical protein
MEDNPEDQLSSYTVEITQDILNNPSAHESDKYHTHTSGAVQLELQSQGRLEKWILAFKLRYWIDFGNQEEYKVDWQRNLNDDGDLVEIIINLANSNCEDDEQSKSLFSIIICLITKKIVIQGDYVDLWKRNEFDKLKTLVSELCSIDNMNQQLISQIYDKVFYDNEDISKANINLEGVSLDIYADSENKSEMKDEITPKQTPTTKSSHKIQKKP